MRWLVQELLETEVSAQIGAERYQRTDERTTHRNGYRDRQWDTRVGTLGVGDPEAAQRELRPELVGAASAGGASARRGGGGSLRAGGQYQEAPTAVGTRALVQSLGIAGISKREVSRLGASLDAQSEARRNRRLDGDYPSIWLDARYEHVREDRWVVSMAVLIAYGGRADGEREVLGLVARGVRGVKLVSSDAHTGLKQAIKEVFVGASWQRCRVHFLRNVLARVPKTAQAMVAATVRTSFEQPDRAAAETQLLLVLETLQPRFPTVVQILEEAEGEILTFHDFPTEHRRQIYSTNLLERLKKELKRRSAVVGIFPNRTAIRRRFGALLAERNDEWLVGHHYFSEILMRKLTHGKEETTAELQEQTA